MPEIKAERLGLIDFDRVNSLLESFNRFTGFVTAILDLDGNVLSKSGLREICTEFHRVNPATSERCRVSDTVLASKMSEGDRYHAYKCLNGLVDVAVPIIIDGEHVANLFTGQFFFEEPDLHFFRKQAEEFGFDEKRYLDALSKVPIVSEEEVKVAMEFLLDMTQMISDLAYQKSMQEELNRQILEAKERAEESEEIYRAMYDNAPLSYQSLDENGCFIDINPMWLRTLGYERDEVIGKWYGDFLHPDYIEHFRINFPTFKKRGYVSDVQFKLRKKDNTYIYVSFEGCIGYTPQGEFRQTYCVFKDITEQKALENDIIKAKERAEESEENLSITLQSIGDGVISTDISGVIERMNPVALKLCGWEEEEAIGKPLTEVFNIINAHTRESVLNPVNRVIEHGEIVGLANHTVLIAKDGKEYQIADSAAPIRDKEGNIRGVVMVFSDVTEKYATEEELRKSRELLSETESVGKVGGWTFNIDTLEQVWTDEVYRIHEVEKSPRPGVEEGINYYAGESKPIIREAVKRAIEYGEDYNLELEIITAKGNRRAVHTIGKADLENRRIYGFFQDITERKQAEAALKKRENLLNKVFDILPVGLWFADENGKLLRGNPAGVKIWGAEPTVPMEEYGVFKARRYPSGEEIKPDEWALVHTIRDGVTVADEQLEIDAFDGKKRIILNYTAPVLDDQGSIQGAIVVNQDITDSKQAELELAESLERFRALHNASFGGIAIHDKGVILECNQGLSDMTGYSVEELIGMDGLLLVHPDQRGMVMHKIITGHEKPYEAIAVRKNGEQYPVRIEGRNIPYKGKTVRTTEFRDITETKKAEEKLKLLNRAIEATSASIVITDAEGNINYVNPYFSELTGYSFGEAIGNNPRILSSGAQSEGFYKELWGTILSGEVWVGEFKNRKKNGEYYWENAVISPILNGGGIVTNFVAIKEDITERKRLQEDLVVAKEKAEESDRLKTAFLNNVSHEIRTPMNAIVGFSALLSDASLDEVTRATYMKIISDSSDHLLAIINDIVDISNVEAGIVKISREEININESIERLSEQFSLKAKEKGVVLRSVIPLPDGEAKLFTDKTRFIQVLSNLINNALKFTNEGSIEIGYKPGQQFVEFYVSDTGIGIPGDQIERIFERFYQVDLELTRLREGTGLGLAISKSFVELMGGEIWVESEPGKGSTFFFTLPCTGAR